MLHLPHFQVIARQLSVSGQRFRGSRISRAFLVHRGAIYSSVGCVFKLSVVFCQILPSHSVVNWFQLTAKISRGTVVLFLLHILQPTDTNLPAHSPQTPALHLSESQVTPEVTSSAGL